MILVADSGSTKTSWIALNKGGEIYFKIETEGLNPVVFSKEILHDRIISKKELIEIRNEVDQLFFYGAGCGSKNASNFLKKIIQTVFVNAEIEIHGDNIAAVRSLQLDAAGIVCILGTGSNCSFFDGKLSHQKTASLGYIIMDEASGNYFGKQLIRDYFFYRMPVDLMRKFESEYDLNVDAIKENLYKKDNPNTYLAQFARFLIENKSNDYAKRTINSGLRLFVESHILQFEESKTVPVHFIGSIAYFLSDEIREVLEEYDMQLGKIIRHPILTLAQYHTTKI